MAEPTPDMELEVVLKVSEINRILLLVHRDLAQVEGQVVLAEKRLADDQRNSGSQRRSDVRIVTSAPEHRALLEDASGALRTALKDARARGHNV